MNVRCVRVEVNCVKNNNCTDPIIEPEYFGYDFFVKEEKLAEYLAFINQTMVHYGLPILSIEAVEHKVVSSKDVFDYQRIVETVSKSKNDIIEAINNNETPKRS